MLFYQNNIQLIIPGSANTSTPAPPNLMNILPATNFTNYLFTDAYDLKVSICLICAGARSKLALCEIKILPLLFLGPWTEHLQIHSLLPLMKSPKQIRCEEILKHY